jgi:DNA topoisomerase VI subunit A
MAMPKATLKTRARSRPKAQSAPDPKVPETKAVDGKPAKPATTISAVEMGARQREISVSEFFTKNLKYRWFAKKEWQEEIKRMLAAGLKYELDALANKDFRYLTKTYLPRKLKERDWLD